MPQLLPDFQLYFRYPMHTLMKMDAVIHLPKLFREAQGGVRSGG